MKSVGKNFYSVEDLKIGEMRTYIIKSRFSDTYHTQVFFKDQLVRQNIIHKKELESFYIEEEEAKRKFPQCFI